MIVCIFCTGFAKTEFIGAENSLELSPLSVAVSRLVIDFYAKTGNLVHVVKIYHSEENKLVLNSMLNEILTLSGELVLFQLEDYSAMFKPSSRNFVILVDELRTFR